MSRRETGFSRQRPVAMLQRFGKVLVGYSGNGNKQARLVEVGGRRGFRSRAAQFQNLWRDRSFTSGEVGDAPVVVEPHVPSAVGGQDPLGLGDESWLRREHGDERGPRFSFLEVLLAHQSFVGHSAAD
jgi:hypothetical protein